METDPKNPPTPKPPQGSWSRPVEEDDDDDDEDDDRTSDDIEEGLRLKAMNTFETAKENIGTGKLSFADIVNDIWHFSSVDYGQRCWQARDQKNRKRIEIRILIVSPDLCMGYNSIYSAPKIRFQSSPSLPDSKRVWCWIILCDDGTSKPHAGRVKQS